MKKLIIGLLIAAPFITFGATTAIKQLNSWEFIGSVSTQNRGNLFLYRMDDPENKNVRCYVLAPDEIKYGASSQLSCVVVK